MVPRCLSPTQGFATPQNRVPPAPGQLRVPTVPPPPGTLRASSAGAAQPRRGVRAAGNRPELISLLLPEGLHAVGAAKFTRGLAGTAWAQLNSSQLERTDPLWLFSGGTHGRSTPGAWKATRIPCFSGRLNNFNFFTWALVHWWERRLFPKNTWVLFLGISESLSLLLPILLKFLSGYLIIRFLWRMVILRQLFSEITVCLFLYF